MPKKRPTSALKPKAIVTAAGEISVFHCITRERVIAAPTPRSTPSAPPARKGARRRRSTACQIAGSVCSWPTIEQASTSGAASRGGRTCSQIGSVTSAVPKPVRPETRPPANAPARTSSDAAPLTRRGAATARASAARNRRRRGRRAARRRGGSRRGGRG